MFSTTIMARETDILRTRRIRGAIELQSQGPTLDRDSGYELPVAFWTFCHVTHRLKARDKKFNVSLLDKDSAKESKDCTLKCVFGF